jgi:Concanavalin A-like lectin/glucanases superfamily/Domain of unknown function (DUF1929)/IPT/TIG domain
MRSLSGSSFWSQHLNANLCGFQHVTTSRLMAMNTKRRLYRRLGFNLIIAVVIGVCFGARQALAQDSVAGKWQTVTPALPFFPVHSHMLPTGKVMIWPGDQGISGNDPRSWDPPTPNAAPAELQGPAPILLTKPGFDTFCTGHSFLADGRLFVAGGHIQNGVGLKNASIYNPFDNRWTALPNMYAGRWYPTTTVLANGDVLVVSGSIDNTVGEAVLPQVCQVGTLSWRNLTSARRGLGLYPMMLLAPNGKVFNAGPSQDTQYLDTNGTGAWTDLSSNRAGPYRDYGSAVMYAPGKVLVVGGGDPPTNTTAVIDLNQTSPTWRAVAPMAVARRQLNATLLPDGNVLVTGGTSLAGFNTPDDSTSSVTVHNAELWNPGTEQWTTLARSRGIPRIYHSTALLLPDGRVLSMGGNTLNRNPDTTTSEIYSPPYLFKGARPTITSPSATSPPASVFYGQSFFVGTPDAAAISKVTMLRLSSVTHAFNMSQHIIEFQRTQGPSGPLTFSQTTGGLNVVAPAGAAVASPATVAPPGYYMLFILNGTGVPSVARIVRLVSDPTAPTLTTLSPSSVATGGGDFTLTVTGSNFVSGSVVQWNGQARTTAFLSATQLTASISASDIAAAGTASVTVRNPNGAISNALTFTITSASSGLVAHWKFDEGAGTTAADSSGNGHTGTLTNGPIWTTGQLGGALQFDGTNDSVACGANVPAMKFAASDSFTESAWVFPTKTGAWQGVFTYSRNASPWHGIWISASNQWGFGGGSGTNLNGPAVNFNAWTHVVAVQTGSSGRKLYVNGVEVASDTLPQAANGTGACLIGGAGGVSEFFGGRIDDVRLYNRALSASEVQALFASP